MLSIGMVNNSVSYGQIAPITNHTASPASKDASYEAAISYYPQLIVQNVPEQRILSRSAGPASEENGGAQMLDDGLIQSHLDRLIEMRQQLLNSEKYKQLTDNQMAKSGDSVWVQDNLEKMKEQHAIMMSSDRYKQLTDNQMAKSGDSAWVQDNLEKMKAQQAIMLASDRYRQLPKSYQPVTD